jgi:hypothetical protein
MSLEESLQLQAVEAAREAEARERAAARTRRKVEEGFARARAMAVADYLCVFAFFLSFFNYLGDYVWLIRMETTVLERIQRKKGEDWSDTTTSSRLRMSSRDCPTWPRHM